ncbi:MAG: cache domain-containing protein [bacterium]|nr:cache domain-containing protein [bacterium]
MKRLVLRTVLPALLAIALFTGVVFVYILPAFDRVIMDQKRLMIRELTESAWNILARCQADEQAGHLTRDQAQAAAVSQVRGLHYGQGSKDYFWIIDEHPRMIVHPYRPDLEGTDLREFADPHGKRLFVEMARVVQADGSGYVSYRWQWKDDSRRIVPKLSYVKGFAPWGWIIGTGVYIEDVAAERAALVERLQTVSLAILLVVSGLLFVLLRAGFQAERARQRLAEALNLSEEKHRTLIESAGESILMAIAGERLFGNPSLLRQLGYEEAAFAGLEVGEVVLPTAAERATGRRAWQDVVSGGPAPAPYEAELRRADGTTLRVNLSLSHIEVRGKAGFMAVATRVATVRDVEPAAANTAEELAAANRRRSVMAALMLTHGTPAGEVMRLLSNQAEAVTRRSLALAEAELGPASGNYGFLLMGSVGRAEASLLTDQDHAIIHDDAPGLAEYCLRLGARVAELLAAAGYARCRGGIMASEPACCRAPEAWRATFSRWIHTLEADDLLQAKVFFDFRPLAHVGGAGDEAAMGLARDLREHLHAEIATQPRFCHLLARSILACEPPLSPFGSFVLESLDGRHATFDIKGVLAQVVDIARLRALQHGVRAVGTVARLESLAAAGALKPTTTEATIAAFRFLQDLRLRHQAAQVLAQVEADNRLEPATLTPAEQAELKRALGHVKALQAAVDHDFAGA